MFTPSEQTFTELGYFKVRVLPDGTWVGLYKLMYTTAICVGLDAFGYTYRFCFEDPKKAEEQIDLLTELDDEPEGYIARRGLKRG